MKTYWKWQKLLTLFLILYFVGGLLSLLTPKQEIFPLYSWFLFAKVPSKEEKYALLIVSSQSKNLVKPIFFEEAGNTVKYSSSISAQRVIQMLGEGFEKRREEQVQTSKKILEERFLHPDTTYQLMKIKYDPLERKKFKKIKEKRTLETFSTPSSSGRN